MEIVIDIPKKMNLGEDAPPINMTSQNGNRKLVGVFDGLGGSGSTTYEEDGCKYSGAYIASRIVRETTRIFFESLLDNSANYMMNDKFLTNYKTQILEALKEKFRKQKFEPSKIKSNLIRTFPTTLSLSHITKKDNSIIIDTLWAGDSRSYIIDPKKGLIQLTIDDLKLKNDPFENIENDSPLSNMINLDEDFSINYFAYTTNAPLIIFSATDGCFGYYPTPMHFEYFLLSTLLNSNNIDEWKENITIELSKVSGDDFSLSLVVETNDLNFNSFKEIYRERQEFIYTNYMLPIFQLEKQIDDLRNQEGDIKNKIIQTEQHKKIENKKLWDSYKTNNYPFNK